MKTIKACTTLIILLVSIPSFCQSGNAEVEMADVLRQDGKIYTVVIGLLVILAGLIFFMLKVDKRVAKIESQMKKSE